MPPIVTSLRQLAIARLTFWVESCTEKTHQKDHFLGCCTEHIKSYHIMPDSNFLSKYQVDLPEMSAKKQLFPKDFKPSSKDVICGRGKGTFAHTGNRRFRVIIAMNLEKYVLATSKSEKTYIVASIVKQIKEASPNGGFLKKDSSTGQWMKMDDHLAKDKVGHALRDAATEAKKAVKKVVAAPSPPPKPQVVPPARRLSVQGSRRLSIPELVLSELLASLPRRSSISKSVTFMGI